ncbi:ATP-dependent Clp protease proteolytic subunit [Pseudomonas viridiflava]|uniref:ATP-dependent Clp protease proteolytic subunit n=1 Tax=Pseudomonas viridiflava TaxID=33069 RepID=UPI003BB75704
MRELAKRPLVLRNADSDVHLSVNCDGGDPSAILAVSDTMRFIPPVATTCVGQAIGVGAVLVAAGI